MRTATRFAAAAACMAATMSWASSSAVAQDKPKHEHVKIELKNSEGQDAGTVTLSQSHKGVRMKISLENLPVGDHGVHIHAVGLCTAPDFKSAGGHFNPTGKHHGFMNPDGHHAGDTPESVTVGEDHKGEKVFVLSDVTLEPGQPNSLFQPNGLSVVVHEKADDEKTDPAGNAGNRIACGLIPSAPVQ